MPGPTLIPTALTSLQAVKDWVYGASPPAGQPAAADPILIDLINKASRLVLTVLSRSNLLVHTVNEVRSGPGGSSLLLAEWPVLGNLTLGVDGSAIPARAQVTTPGWVIANPWDGIGAGTQALLMVTGSAFTRGIANVSLSYTAGYGITDEPQTIDSSGNVSTNNPSGPWAANTRVTYADGTVLTPVTSGPTVGQYIPPPDPTQSYAFNVGEAGTVVLMSYSFVPYELAYVTAKWVGEWYKYRARIGEKSQTLGGQQTAAFDLSAMPADVKLALTQFTRVVPLRS